MRTFIRLYVPGRAPAPVSQGMAFMTSGRALHADRKPPASHLEPLGLLPAKMSLVKALPVLLAVAAVALSGCSPTENAAPCKDFEATYNAVDLRDKLRVNDASGDDYRPSLKRLADTARAGSAKASGDVKTKLESFAGLETMYAKTASESNLPYSFLDLRIRLSTTRDGLVEACQKSGYPIALEPDHPSR